MNQTIDRTAQIGLLSQEWNTIEALVAPLDEAGWRTPSALPGWTVFDLVAHVVGAESWLLGEQPPAHDPSRPKVDVRSLTHVRNDTAVANEIWVDRLRPLSGAELLERYRDVTSRRCAALRAMDDATWANVTMSPVGSVSYGRFMQVRFFDCWMHELDIADALGVHVEEGGPRGELAFTELAGGVPRAVVKQGGAPQGARITFALTGPLAKTLCIQVAGRASYVDSFDSPATVEITMDSGLFVRLASGRTTAAEHADKITVNGDAELGRQLVGHLAFIM
ncbi:maleylpyruvate isomerase family mycothiol-dependent enzyme [Nocardia sp. CNY236]|uniref:maleylpyruvate isomerase family mycothiol-dependent enzyme n=1 Tax=Nocardia sp. CNY236 TaxID=1169152 RepID=UPI0003FD3543|nr:maleylpyruvate isomerase family mycothiol-dependent enzyme [Nocardia sp. CNY236]